MRLPISPKGLNVVFILFLIAIAVFVNFFVLNNGLVHDMPFIQASSDANMHTCFSEGLLKTRDYRYRPAYMAAGISDTLHYSPPLLYILTLMISDLSGIPVHDAVFLVVSLSFILPIIPIYYLVRRYFNEKIALAAVVLALFPLNPFWIYAVRIGFWIFALGSFFIPFILLSLFKLVETKHFRYAVFLGLLFSAQFFAHPPVAIVLLPFIGLYSLYSLVKQKDIRLLKSLLFSALLSIALSFWYILDFYFGYVKGPAYSTYGITWFKSASAYGFTMPTISFISPLFLLFMGVGVLALLFFDRKHIRNPLVSWLLFFTLFTFSSLIGVEYWPMRFRLLWMFYFSIIAAYGLFIAFKAVKKERFFFASLLLILSYGVYMQADYNAQGGPLLTPKEHDAIKWIRANTNDSDRFMVLFGFWQNSMCYSQRPTFEVQTPYLVENANKEVIPTQFQGSYLFQLNDLPRKQGFMRYAYFVNDTYPSVLESACAVDYVIANYNVTGHPLETYNAYVLNDLLKHDFELAYENGGVAIIRNRELREKC